MKNIKQTGVLKNGDFAPENTDKARLNWLSLHPGIVKNLKAGIIVKGIEIWQPSLRAAIDAAMETMRQELRSKNAEPNW